MKADQYAEEYAKVVASYGLDQGLTWLVTSLMRRTVEVACHRSQVSYADVISGKAQVKNETVQGVARETIQMWRKIARKNPELNQDGFEELLKKKGLL